MREKYVKLSKIDCGLYNKLMQQSSYTKNTEKQKKKTDDISQWLQYQQK